MQGTEGQEVDPWENPNFELYHITDRFGFMQLASLLLPASILIHRIPNGSHRSIDLKYPSDINPEECDVD